MAGKGKSGRPTGRPAKAVSPFNDVGRDDMRAVMVRLSPEDYELLNQICKRETRSRPAQLVHMLREYGKWDMDRTAGLEDA